VIGRGIRFFCPSNSSRTDDQHSKRNGVLIRGIPALKNGLQLSYAKRQHEGDSEYGYPACSLQRIADGHDRDRVHPRIVILRRDVSTSLSRLVGPCQETALRRGANRIQRVRRNRHRRRALASERPHLTTVDSVTHVHRENVGDPEILHGPAVVKEQKAEKSALLSIASEFAEAQRLMASDQVP